MKAKFFNALSLAVIMAMLITSLALADGITADADALVFDPPQGNNTSATQSGGTTASYDFSAYIKNTGNANNDVFRSGHPEDYVSVTITRSGDWLDGGTPASFTFTAYDSDQASAIGITIPCGAEGTTKTMKVDLSATASNGENLSPNSVSLYYVITAGPDDPSCAPADTTPPVITPSVTGTLGNNGWYVSDVTVSWSVVDNESTVTSTTGCDPTTINYDTAGVTLTCSATSAGGTSSQSVTVKRDATAPTLAPTVSPNPVFLNGSATASANASDLLSLVASSGCDPVNTGSVGTFNVNCFATDNAGNTAYASAPYTVIYKICALYDQTKSHKSGSTVPVKLQLCDVNGVNYSSADIVVHATGLSKEDPSASSIVDDSGAANSPDNNFRYDASLAGYIFNLSTKGLSSGTWKLTFNVDGQGTYSVEFDVK